MSTEKMHIEAKPERNTEHTLNLSNKYVKAGDFSGGFDPIASFLLDGNENYYLLTLKGVQENLDVNFHILKDYIVTKKGVRLPKTAPRRRLVPDKIIDPENKANITVTISFEEPLFYGLKINGNAIKDPEKLSITDANKQPVKPNDYVFKHRKGQPLTLEFNYPKGPIRYIRTPRGTPDQCVDVSAVYRTFELREWALLKNNLTGEFERFYETGNFQGITLSGDTIKYEDTFWDIGILVRHGSIIKGIGTEGCVQVPSTNGTSTGGSYGTSTGGSSNSNDERTLYRVRYDFSNTTDYRDSSRIIVDSINTKASWAYEAINRSKPNMIYSYTWAAFASAAEAEAAAAAYIAKAATLPGWK